jgi:hypothetical protein
MVEQLVSGSSKDAKLLGFLVFVKPFIVTICAHVKID